MHGHRLGMQWHELLWVSIAVHVTLEDVGIHILDTGSLIKIHDGSWMESDVEAVEYI